MQLKTQRPSRVSPGEYLDRERDGAVRHEFVGGIVYAMSAASQRHNIVTGNWFAALHSHLRAPCLVFTSDMKLRTEVDEVLAFYYPDVLISCDLEDGQNAYYRERPVLIVEVLSPSTERIDRGEKFDVYTSLPSLTEYVLADQDIPKVELFRRRTAWGREEFYRGDVLTLESVGLDITVEQIYQRLDY